MPGFSIETFGGRRLLESVTKQIEFAHDNYLITTRQMWLLKEPLLRVQDEAPPRKPETPQDWAELVALLEAEEGKSFWVPPVKQPESLFTDAPPEQKIRKSDLAKFVRAKVMRYIPQEEARRSFLCRHRLEGGAPGVGAVQPWDVMVDGLFYCVLQQRHQRRQVAEAGVGLRAVYQLAEAMRSRAPRVPIRKQEARVEIQFALRSDRPVVAQVTTVLFEYGLVYLQIGWRRPAVVTVGPHGWTDGLRALRRGDRCLLWITGLQRNHMGHELLVATFEPPNQASISLDLPRSLLRHRIANPDQTLSALSPTRMPSPLALGGVAIGGGGRLPSLITLSPPPTAGGGERPCPSPTFNHSRSPQHHLAAAGLAERPSVLDVRSSITSDGRSTVALPDLAKAGASREAAAMGGGGGGEGEEEREGVSSSKQQVVVIESLLQELRHGVEFQDDDCPEPLLGLRALGERLDLRAATVSPHGTVTLDGPMDAVLEALDRLIRIAARWAVVANDPVALAGLDLKYVSPRPVWLPALRSCASARFNGPLGHPYHALEEEMWPRRFALVPVLDPEQHRPTDAYLIAAESADVAEGGLEAAAQWERQEAEERARKAKAQAQAPLLFSPTSGTIAARKAAAASPMASPGEALRRPAS